VRKQSWFHRSGDVVRKLELLPCIKWNWKRSIHGAWSGVSRNGSASPEIPGSIPGSTGKKNPKGLHLGKFGCQISKFQKPKLDALARF